MRFVRFFYYKTANRTAPCGVVRCSALLLAVWCGCVIVVRLCHFAGGLGAVFAVCAVYAVW